MAWLIIRLLFHFVKFYVLLRRRSFFSSTRSVQGILMRVLGSSNSFLWSAPTKNIAIVQLICGALEMQELTVNNKLSITCYSGSGKMVVSGAYVNAAAAG